MRGWGICAPLAVYGIPPNKLTTVKYHTERVDNNSDYHEELYLQLNKVATLKYVKISWVQESQAPCKTPQNINKLRISQGKVLKISTSSLQRNLVLIFVQKVFY